MSRFFSLLLTLLLCCLTPPAVAQMSVVSGAEPAAQTGFARGSGDFLPVDRAFQAYAWHHDGRLYVGLRSQPGYYLYRHRLDVTVDTPASIGALDLPPGSFKHDPYLGDVHVFHDDVVISAPLTVGTTDSNAVAFTLSFQGCAEAGLCYPPEHWQLTARQGDAPAAFTDASSQAQASPLGDTSSLDPGDGSAAGAVTKTPQADPIAHPAIADDPFGSGRHAGLASPSTGVSGEASTTASQTTTSRTASHTAAPRVDHAAPAGSGAAAWESQPKPSFAASSVRFESLLSGGIDLVTLGLFFLAGVGLTLTPCVLPMMPILASIIVGQNASRARALTLSLSYVTGMAVTFTALGTLMGLFGASFNLQARLQSPWILVPLALLFGLFAAAMFGAFDLRLPRSLGQRIGDWQARLTRSGPGGLALTGALSVLVVSPCISAPLAGALVFISTTGDTLGGALALLALALGMGLPLVLVGGFGAHWLPRAGAWMNGIKTLFGVALLAIAIWLVARLVPAAAALVLWGVLSLGVAMALGALDTRTPNGWPRVRQTLGWLALAWGVALVWGGAQGNQDPLRPLASSAGPSNAAGHELAFETVTTPAQLDHALRSASDDGRPVMVDVSADWCISCQVMERRVFPAPEVADQLAGFTLVRADVTADSDASRALLSRYDLFGPPGLLFFVDGQELRDARIQGEVGASALADHLTAVANAG
ncbi:protein-disulfide reductase DsbD [Salinicola aestuarinus]|uniref:protein-disulfide reductase DsbD n=1 Tax=Salinicola aestuarinus TaxID=1949082 RepID=UPI00165FAF51|nr:protein-disulfide reductase DsbD [Salinicola aestuarinus]